METKLNFNHPGRKMNDRHVSLHVYVYFVKFRKRARSKRARDKDSSTRGSPKRLASPRSSATKRSASTAPSLVLYRAEHALFLSLFLSPLIYLSFSFSLSLSLFRLLFSHRRRQFAVDTLRGFPPIDP